eukprot:Hpha_TRINITY_DN32668_c0_g1::TRINITY_DN32668_c0_g1_i1::g.30303::m.30303
MLRGGVLGRVVQLRHVRRQWRTGMTLTEARRELGVEVGASQAVVHERFVALARIHHPDRAGGDGGQMQRINAAYELVRAVSTSTSGQRERRRTQHEEERWEERWGAYAEEANWHRAWRWAEEAEVRRRAEETRRATEEREKRKEAEMRDLEARFVEAELRWRRAAQRWQQAEDAFADAGGERMERVARLRWKEV